MILLSSMTAVNAETILKNSCDSSINKSIKIPWFKIAWKILITTTDSWIDREPTYTEYSNSVSVSSGHVDFNEGDIGAKLRKDVEVTADHQEFDIFAQTNPLAFLRTIGIWLEDTDRNQKVSRSVTHNQHTYYGVDKDDSLGNWLLEFNEDSKTWWDCWVVLRDHMDKKSIQTNTIETVDIINRSTSEKRNVKFYKTNDTTYLMPSHSHQQEISVYNEISFKELTQELYDSETGIFVDDFKNFRVGDTVLVKDKLIDIVYDDNYDVTYLKFYGINKNDIIKWPFKGNLENKYSSGDILNFKFKVLKGYSDENITTETLNYISEAKESELNKNYPDINQYIVK